MSTIVGQKYLLNYINKQIDDGKLSRFVILVGARGSGKKLVADYIATKLSNTVVHIGTKVGDIRDMIQNVYKITSPSAYIIADVDNMSLAAKNAMLKVTEEPPNNAYFIMTVQDDNRLLDTIKSRGTVLHMEAYTHDEIEEYVKEYISDKTDISIFTEICETIGDVRLLQLYDVKKFYRYVQLVVDNISTVSGSNSFKIADKINFKSDVDKYDLTLFLRAFVNMCSKRAGDYMQSGDISNMEFYFNWMKITFKYLRELEIKGINKAATFDCWMLDIREATFE